MTELQKEFEKTGYTSWINSDIYPDGKIYTKEYTEWLEKRVKNNIVLADVRDLDGKTIPVKFKVTKFKPNIVIDIGLANDC